MRKNAVFALYSIFKQFEYLVPDAPELIQTFLAVEADTTCKRNAFVMLTECSREMAVEWLKSMYTSVSGMDELMQLAVIELIRKDFSNSSEKVLLALTPAQIHSLHF